MSERIPGHETSYGTSGDDLHTRALIPELLDLILRHASVGLEERANSWTPTPTDLSPESRGRKSKQSLDAVKITIRSCLAQVSLSDSLPCSLLGSRKTMSAAVRPTAAILRRTRHAPVTQCIARRWQTSGGQPATYDEMLELMEAEFPGPYKRQSRPARTREPSMRDQLAQQHTVQQHEPIPSPEQHNQPDSYSGPTTTYQPIAASDSASNYTPAPRTFGIHEARPEPRYQSAKSAPPRPARNPTQDEYRPRRVPLPVYKPSPDQVTDRQTPEKPTRRTSPPSPEPPEHAQARETFDSVDFLNSIEALESSPVPVIESALKSAPILPPQPTLESSPAPVAEPSRSTPETNDQDPVPTRPTISRKPRTPVATTTVKIPSVKATKKKLVQHDPPEEDGEEDASVEVPTKSSKTVRMNPLETIKLDNPVSKGVRQVFDNIFLRDSCSCAQCVDTSTRQKRFDSADIPSNIRIRYMTSDAHTGDVILTWKHDIPGFGPDHTTVLPYQWLKQAPHAPVTHTYQDGKRAWGKRGISAGIKTFDYNDYMSDDKVLWELLRQLQLFGLAFIKNLPEAESSVIQTANRIGPLKNTFYGETWDVRSVSNAKNVAYTDVHLGFHMDLLYMQQPPRLQLLHCLRASEQGGVSLFSDSYRAMQQLHKLDQGAFWTLVNTPVNFHYDNDNHHYFRSRRTFELQQGITEIPEDSDEPWAYMEAVNWAPPFQAPFNHTEGDVAFVKSMRAWHRAAQMFRDLTELRTAVYQRQMKPGECVIFDNRRILHARTAFAGGERWLRGAYLDDDPYLSKMRVLERTDKVSKSTKVWAKSVNVERNYT